MEQQYKCMLQQLEASLAELGLPSCPQQRRAQLESELAQFRDHWPDAQTSAIAMLEMGLESVTRAVEHQHPQNQKDFPQFYISLSAVHFLCSVVDCRGGDVARLQMQIGSHDARLQFIYAVRNLLLKCYFFPLPGVTTAPSFVSAVIRTAKSQLTVAYCRMMRCAWLNRSLLVSDSSTAAVLESIDLVLDCCKFAASNVATSLGNVEFGVTVLSTFCEEISRNDRTSLCPLPFHRRKEIQSEMSSRATKQIMECFTIVLTNQCSYLVDLDKGISASAALFSSRVVKSCFRGVDAILSFHKSLEMRVVDISTVVSVDLLRSCFSLIDRIHHSRTNAGRVHVQGLQECGCHALECISEIISRNCWPKGQAEEFVIELATRTISTLEAQVTALHLSKGGEVPLEEQSTFRSQLTHFLDSFCMYQLSRASRMPTFDMSRFLTVMTEYSFALLTVEEFTEALVPWMKVAGFVTSAVNKDGNVTFLKIHQDGLASVLASILQYNFFSCNGPKLTELYFEGFSEFDDVTEFLIDEEEEEEEMNDGYLVEHGGGLLDDESADLKTQYSHVYSMLRSQPIGDLLGETCSFATSLCALSPAIALAANNVLLNRLKEIAPQIDKILSTARAHQGDESISLESWDLFACVRFLECGGVSVAFLSHSFNTGRDAAQSSDQQEHISQFVEVGNLIFSCCDSFLSSLSYGTSSPAVSHLFAAFCSCLGAMGTGLLTLSSHHRSIQSYAEPLSARILSFCSRALCQVFPSLISQFEGKRQPFPHLSAYIFAVCDLWKRTCDTMASSLLKQDQLMTRRDTVDIMANHQTLVANILQNLGASFWPSMYPVNNRHIMSHIGMIYQGAFKLLFPFARECNMNAFKNPSDKSAYESQAEITKAVVLKGLCEQLMNMTAQVQGFDFVKGSAFPPAFQQSLLSIEWACSSLTAICNAVKGMGAGAKKVLASAIGPTMDQILQLLGRFTSFILNGEDSMVAVASSLLGLQISVLDCLQKEVGTEYQSKAISSILQAMSSAPQNKSFELSSGQMMAQKALLKLFIVTFNTRNKNVAVFLPQVFALFEESIIPLSIHPSNSSELFPLFLNLVHVVFNMHWKYFTTSTVDNLTGGATASLIGGNVEGNMRPNLFAMESFGKRTIRISNAQRFHEIKLLMDVLHDAIISSDKTPSIVGLTVSLLRSLGRSVKLFKVEEFSASMKPKFISMLMEALLARHQPLLVDEISLLLFEMAESDMDNFFGIFLPGVINSLPMNDTLKEAVRVSWPSEKDSTSFCVNCHSFLSEYRFGMKCAMMQEGR